MRGELNVVINLGNDAMRTPEDVADVLEELVETLRGENPDLGRQGPEEVGGKLRDVNGNSVGGWKLAVEADQ